MGEDSHVVTNTGGPLGPSNANAWSSFKSPLPSMLNSTLSKRGARPVALDRPLWAGLPRTLPIFGVTPQATEEGAHLHQPQLALLLEDPGACTWPQTLESSLRVEPEDCVGHLCYFCPPWVKASLAPRLCSLLPSWTYSLRPSPSCSPRCFTTHSVE